MKNRAMQFLTICLLMTGLMSCGGVSQSEFETLKAENDKLKKEIEDLKFGPDKLLTQSKSFIESKDYQNAKKELQSLLDKHPGSTQAIEAKQLILFVDSGIREEKLAQDKAKLEKEKAEKDRLANATKKMRIKFDDMDNMTWYFDKSSPQYVNYNGFYAYIGQSKGSKPSLRLSIQYASDDWLFIEKYIIKVDGQTYTISENSYGEIKTDNGSGGIWEWIDRKVGSSEYQILKAVANGKDLKIRFEGKDYYKDKTITAQQKTALRNVLDAYEALGGDSNF